MLKGQVFSEQLFENKIFALFINLFLNKKNGVIKNYQNQMGISYSGSNITIASGAICIQGRFLNEDSSTTIDAGTSDLYCKLVIEIDLSKTNTENDFQQAYYKIVTSATGYPTLTQTDIANNNTGIYQYELARFRTSSNGISNFQDMRTYINDELQYQQIDNLNSSKAPTNHASSASTYGLGTTSIYGHCKIINNLTSSAFINGEALSAYQGKVLKGYIDTAQNTANQALSNANAAAGAASNAAAAANNAQSSANSAANAAAAKLPLAGGTLNGNLNMKGNLVPWHDSSSMSSIKIGYSDYPIDIIYTDKLNITSDRGISNPYGPLYNDGESIRSQYIYDEQKVTNSPNMYITSNGWFRRTTNTSSRRYKKEIKDLMDENLDPEKLYNLPVKQFKYKEDYQPQEGDARYNKTLLGFIAEDVADIYPIAADYEIDKDGMKIVENWNERYIIPAMLSLLQKQNIRIKALEERLGVTYE